MPSNQASLGTAYVVVLLLARVTEVAVDDLKESFCQTSGYMKYLSIVSVENLVVAEDVAVVAFAWATEEEQGLW